MPLQVPCGKCIGCASDKARVWAIRMHHEASLHKQNCFITLTYKTAPTHINKRDLQLFFKRLRRLCRLRYFACGEYGTITRRPHYHAVVFGQDFLGHAYQINDQLYGNPFVDKTWGHGLVSIGRITMASCAYVAGYCTKKAGDPDTFNLMSRRPGIGHKWLDKYKNDIVRTGNVVIEGREYPVPPRYLQWEESEFTAIKQERQRYFQNLTPWQKWERIKQLEAREAIYKTGKELRIDKL